MTAADRERLVRIETKLDQALFQSGDHEKRLRSVEKFRWLQTGASGVLGALLTLGIGAFRAYG